MLTLGFDIYGTLIDTNGVVDLLRTMVGKEAAVFSKTWREKQLEYTFRRTAMNRYVNFSIVTKEALDYCNLAFNNVLNAKQKEELMHHYSELPAFQDVEKCLTSIKGRVRIFAFSNGTHSAINFMLQKAAIDGFFDGVVSVDSVSVFKPHPATYEHFLNCTKSQNNTAILVSSNPFDIIGAKSKGLHAIWVKRNQNNYFDPWTESAFIPDQTIHSLSDLSKVLETFS